MDIQPGFATVSQQQAARVLKKILRDSHNLFRVHQNPASEAKTLLAGCHK